MNKRTATYYVPSIFQEYAWRHLARYIECVNVQAFFPNEHAISNLIKQTQAKTRGGRSTKERPRVRGRGCEKTNKSSLVLTEKASSLLGLSRPKFPITSAFRQQRVGHKEGEVHKNPFLLRPTAFRRQRATASPIKQ